MPHDVQPVPILSAVALHAGQSLPVIAVDNWALAGTGAWQRVASDASGSTRWQANSSSALASTITRLPGVGRSKWLLGRSLVRSVMMLTHFFCIVLYSGLARITPRKPACDPTVGRRLTNEASHERPQFAE